MRIVSMELDSAYFDFAQAAIKSFARYNPDWRFKIGNIGLEKEQGEELSSFADVVSRKRFDCAHWPFRLARYLQLSELVAGDYELVCRLDADTLTFGSLEPFVAEFLQSDSHLAVRPAVYEVGTRLGNLAVTGKYFKQPEQWCSRPGCNAGVMLMKPSPELLAVVRRTHELMRDHPGIFWSDDTTLISNAYDSGLTVMQMPDCYNRQITLGRGITMTCFDPPLDPQDRPIVVAHMVGHKSMLLRMDGRHYPLGWWWRRWMRRYGREPWPTT